MASDDWELMDAMQSSSDLRTQVGGPSWDTFLVSLSEGLLAALSAQHGGDRSVPRGGSLILHARSVDRLASFCAKVQRALNPILARPEIRETPVGARRLCTKRNLDVTPRSSVRIAMKQGRGSVAMRQKQVIMRKLCIASEGEVIGEAALQAYVDLFLSPLSDAHIAAVLALFG